MMSDPWAAAVQIIGAVSTLLLTFAQFAWPTVLRRRTEWLKETLKAEKSQNRRRVITEQLLRAQGELIAGLKVSLWRIFPLLIFVVAVGDILTIQAVKSANLFDLLGIVALNGLNFTIATRPGIRIYCQRRMVAERYSAGRNFPEPDFGILHLVEGGAKREIFIGIAVSYVLTLMTVGLGLLLKGDRIPGVMAVVVSGICLFYLCGYIRAYAVKRARE